MAHSSFAILSAIVADQLQSAADGLSRALSDAKVRNARPKAKADTLIDGGGLSLYIPPTGSKVWRYRYRIAGKPGILTIGAYPQVSLEDARKAHRGARWLVERGEQPIHYIERETARIEAEQAAKEFSTFAAVVAKWLDATESALAGTTAKHRTAMLDKHVLPKLGDKPIADIRRKELAELLAALDQATPETAKHCRIYIKQVFDWAIERELVTGNPTPLSRVLVNQSSRTATPRKALSINRMGEFLRTLNDAPDSDPLTKAAMKLLILTWCRTAEVTGAKWAEFDLDGTVWCIPAERMKANEVHTVYLSAQAVELLRELRNLTGAGQYVFPNRRRPDGHMCRMTLTSWRKRWGFGAEMDVHGIRATCSTWANESGMYRPDVIEVALAHKENDRVRAAYNRAKFIDELRQLWQDWADLCDEKEAAARGVNVVTADFGKVASA